MVYVWCNNEACSNYAKEDILVKAQFKYENGKTVLSNIPRCPICGKEMFYREEYLKKEGSIDVAFTSFNSKSSEDKADILKKRYNDNIKKENIDEVIKNKREKVTKQFFGLD